MYVQGINVARPRAADFKKSVGRFSHRTKERFWELDFLRGLCVVLMVFDHFMYCLWDIMPSINQMLGTDPVALDTAAARLIKFKLNRIGHIRIGESLGVGTTKLGSLNIKRITV